ncbi:MAG: hypothetical protein AAB387_11180, partial [candidate division NC10 bacterium]
MRWRRPSVWPRPWMGPAVWALIAAFLVWNAVSLQVDLARVARGLGRLGTLVSRAFPPDFSRAGLLASGMLESIEIATLSTVFGVLLGIPVAVLAARNVVPLWVYGGGRSAISLGRTFHELIVAILFFFLRQAQGSNNQ